MNTTLVPRTAEQRANDAAREFEQRAEQTAMMLAALPTNDDLHAAADAVRAASALVESYERFVTADAVAFDGIERCAWCGSCRADIHYVNPPDLFLCTSCCAGCEPLGRA